MARLFVTAFAVSTLWATTLLAGGVDERSLPSSKRTSVGLYITAKDAYEKWKADSTSVKIIDVRTPEEFRLIGFPEMAAKIPLSSSPQQFVGQVRRVAKPADTLLVICR